MNPLIFPTVVKSQRSAHVIPFRLAVSLKTQADQTQETHDHQDHGRQKQKLERLIAEHQKLHEALHHMSFDPTVNGFNIQRIKKHKLFLKDSIARLKDQIFPDIIA